MGFLEKATSDIANTALEGLGFGDKNKKETNYKVPSTSFEDFINRFTDVDSKYIDEIDPLQTFDVKFIFFPANENKSNDKKKKGFLSSLGNKLKTTAIKGVNNAVNNATGGLLTSLKNKDHNILKLKSEYKEKGEESFINYLAPANMLIGNNKFMLIDEGNDIQKPLNINLGLYIQSMSIPAMKVNNEGKATTPMGTFVYPTNFLETENKQLNMNVLNTKASLHERIFYPWLRETTLPYWSYTSQPYTTATIVVDFSKHNSFRYVFVGCRPMSIDSIQPTNEPIGNATRKVTFLFDAMFIQSDLEVIDSFGSKLLGTGKTLINGATKFL